MPQEWLRMLWHHPGRSKEGVTEVIQSGRAFRHPQEERDTRFDKRHAIDIFHIIPRHLVLTSCPLS